jgi:S1-C subfamily serine protease
VLPSANNPVPGEKPDNPVPVEKTTNPASEEKSNLDFGVSLANNIPDEKRNFTLIFKIKAPLPNHSYKYLVDKKEYSAGTTGIFATKLKAGDYAVTAIAQKADGSEVGRSTQKVTVVDNGKIVPEPVEKGGEVKTEKVTAPAAAQGSEVVNSGESALYDPHEAMSNKVLPSVVFIHVEKRDSVGSGSGFVIAPGIVATNYHVIEDAREIVVNVSTIIVDQQNQTGRAPAFGASVQLTDKTHDLALLKVSGLQAPALPVIPFPKDKNTFSIYIAGNPGNAKAICVPGTAHKWEKTRCMASGEEIPMLPIAAPGVTEGSSGSAVLDLSGNVIAICTQGPQKGTDLAVLSDPLLELMRKSKIVPVSAERTSVLAIPHSLRLTQEAKLNKLLLSRRVPGSLNLTPCLPYSLQGLENFLL